MLDNPMIMWQLERDEWIGFEEEEYDELYEELV